MKTAGYRLPLRRIISLIFLAPFQILLIIFPLGCSLLILIKPRILRVSSLFVLGFFLVMFMLSLILKRTYCGFICGITTFFYLQKITRKRKPALARPTPKTIGIIIRIVQCLFPVPLLLAWKFFGFSSLPVSFFLLCGIYPLGVILSLTTGRSPEQHYLCPIAPYLLTGSRLGKSFRQLSVLASSENCRHCGRCTETCLIGNDIPGMLVSGNWNQRDCMNCGECIAACPGGALSYGFIKE